MTQAVVGGPTVRGSASSSGLCGWGCMFRGRMPGSEKEAWKKEEAVM